MNIQECYTQLGGNYEDVLGRLRSEKLVTKFAVKFLADKSYDLLMQSLDSRDYETAFRAVHTLKGTCLNLSFSRLYESSAELTEALRDGKTENLSPLAQKVTEDYRKTIDAIHLLEQ